MIVKSKPGIRTLKKPLKFFNFFKKKVKKIRINSIHEPTIGCIQNNMNPNKKDNFKLLVKRVATISPVSAWAKAPNVCIVKIKDG